MSTILKEGILPGKYSDTASKEKIDKIMNTIVDQSGILNQEKVESTESTTLPEQMKTRENSIKQYIFSNEILIDGENVSDLDEIRNRFIKELKPSDEIELVIVDRIISSVWRLKRCLRIESQIMEYAASYIQEYEQGLFRTRKRTDKELTQLKALKIAESKNRVEELSKYETMLERQIYRALSELERLRRREIRQEKKASRKAKQA